MKRRTRLWAHVAVIVVIGFLGAQHAAAQDHAVAGRNSTCVVSTRNQLYCTGASVGNGDVSVPHPAPVIPNGIGVASAVALSIFNNYVCAINSDSAIWCWSSDGIRVPFRIQTPTSPSLPLVNAKSIGVGASGVPGGWDACALLPLNFAIACWQFGSTGSAVNLNDIVDATGNTLYGFEQVSVGYGFGCAVRGTDKAVLCWGINDVGQLGRGTVSNDTTVLSAAEVPGVKASMVSVGFNHACAVSLDASVLCWGSDEYGQLGNGQANVASNLPFASPQTVTGISKVTTVSAGYMFSCAALADASVRCWGQNQYKKLGAARGARRSYSPTPVPVNLGPGGPLNYAVVSAGHDHACASGTYGGLHLPQGNVTGLGLFVKCWGSNAYGQVIH